MKTSIKAIALAIIFGTLASCSSFAATPTLTPTALPTAIPSTTPTSIPTETPPPPTDTPSAPGLPLPSGTPATDWEGLPIMPNALAGDGDSTSYSFTIQASPDAVQAFYQTKLKKLGWSLLASGQGKTGAVLLIFTKEAGTASVSIFSQADGVVLVMLVK